MDAISVYVKYILDLLLTPNGIAAMAGVVGLIWLYRIYDRSRLIPGLRVVLVEDDTWFIHRDDTHRLVAVVTLELTNTSGQEVSIANARFSGYSPKEITPPILLEGKNTSTPLQYPDGVHYYRGMDYRLSPFATQRLWMYYESGSVDLRNRMSAPLVLRAADGRRTSVVVETYRHATQLELYREQ